VDFVGAAGDLGTIAGRCDPAGARSQPRADHVALLCRSGRNQIELQIDNFATVEENTAFIESESFARNPIGALFDPAVMLAGLRTGKTVAELTVPTW